MATHDRGELEVDQLADRADAPIQVISLDGASLGAASDEGARAPHRHDYHELVWVRSGCGSHLLDGEQVEVMPGTVTLIGRGQVHVFEGASDLHGAVVRFNEDMLYGTASDGSNPAWMLAGRGGRTVRVPAGEAAALEATIGVLADEVARPSDRCTTDLERHLLLVLLHWMERWYDAGRTERRDADDSEVQLHRRFAQLLETEFARHHDAGWYADELAVPAPGLSRALAQVTGKATKELVLDRVMLEAARLLRFTDLSVGQVADAVGFTDPLYFSRAFKRHHGVAPQGFRGRSRALA